MKYFGVRIIQEVWVEVPDELHDQVLADIQQHGTVVSDFKTEQELIEASVTPTGRVALEAARAKLRRPAWHVRVWRWLTGKGRR